MVENEKKQRENNGKFAKGNKIGNRFTPENQPTPENKSVGKRKAIAEKKEIERSALILERLLNKDIVNNNTGEVMTQKEAMLLTLLSQAIKEKNLKAIEMILKIIGDIDNASTKIVNEIKSEGLQLNIQPVKANE